jgi:hypothetical protein
MDGYKHCEARQSSLVAGQTVSNDRRLLDPEEQSITTLRNVGKHLPIDTV